MINPSPKENLPTEPLPNFANAPLPPQKRGLIILIRAECTSKPKFALLPSASTPRHLRYELQCPLHCKHIPSQSLLLGTTERAAFERTSRTNSTLIFRRHGVAKCAQSDASDLRACSGRQRHSSALGLGKRVFRICSNGKSARTCKDDL